MIEGNYMSHNTGLSIRPAVFDTAGLSGHPHCGSPFATALHARCVYIDSLHCHHVCDDVTYVFSLSCTMYVM